MDLRRMVGRFALATTALVCLALAPNASWACSTPVFRYALERWPADAYELLVFDRGPSPSLTASTDVNLEIRAVDLTGEISDSMQRLWRRHGDTPPPWMVLRRPGGPGRQAIAWTGAATKENFRAAISSPARREIARRILDGHSAVWVLLTDGQADDGAEAMLRAELVKLQQTLRLPEFQDTITDGPNPVRLEFSVLRIDRHDPAERIFVSMLLSTEPDLAGSSAPMALPVFGRGRVLYALVGEGIEPRNIRQACQYVIGSCSCEVKRQNPGTDLLMSVDWDAGVKHRVTDEWEAPDPLELSAPIAAAPDPPVTMNRTESNLPAAKRAGGPLRLQWILMTVGGAMLTGSVILYGLLRKPGERG